MYIDYSPEFKRLFKKLAKDIKLEAIKKENIFLKDQYDPCLKTHKLSGKLKGKLAFSISYTYRIIFSFTEDKNIRFHSIGTHDIYK